MIRILNIMIEFWGGALSYVAGCIIVCPFEFFLFFVFCFLFFVFYFYSSSVFRQIINFYKNLLSYYLK